MREIFHGDLLGLFQAGFAFVPVFHAQAGVEQKHRRDGQVFGEFRRRGFNFRRDPFLIRPEHEEEQKQHDHHARPASQETPPIDEGMVRQAFFFPAGHQSEIDSRREKNDAEERQGFGSGQRIIRGGQRGPGNRQHDQHNHQNPQDQKPQMPELQAADVVFLTLLNQPKRGKRSFLGFERIKRCSKIGMIANTAPISSAGLKKMSGLKNDNGTASREGPQFFPTNRIGPFSGS